LIEAFEIGVTLALRDGVSESIAQAQRNVEALEKAVNANGLSVRALREAGARAISLVGFQPAQGKVQKKAEPRIAQPDLAEAAPRLADISRPVQTEPSDAPVLHAPDRIEISRVVERVSTETTREGIAAAPVDAVPSPRDEPALGRNDHVAPILPQEITQSQKIDFAASTDELTDRAPQAEFAAPASRPDVQSLPVAGEAEQPVWASPAPLPAATPDQKTDVLPAVPPAVMAENGAIHTISLAQNNPTIFNAGSLQQTVLDDWVPRPAQSEDAVAQDSSTDVEGKPYRAGDRATFASPRVDTPVAPNTYRDPEPQQDPISLRDPRLDEPLRAAWYSSSTRFHTVVTGALPQAESAPQSVAPQERGHAQGAAGGDVFLDGALVGRWVSRFLRREVERADAGPTGFDAKRGRLLPGVTVGG
jgi:hypothetical protein